MPTLGTIPETLLYHESPSGIHVEVHAIEVSIIQWFEQRTRRDHIIVPPRELIPLIRALASAVETYRGLGVEVE